MNKILNQILNNDIITIYHHVRPDGDAIFSSLALYEYLKSNFKSKKIILCGTEESDLVKVKFSKVSDKTISNSLAIVLDTANKERIDDNRCLNAKLIVKIDHHPNLDPYGTINNVNDTAVATSEVLYELLTSKDFKKYKINSKCANYLFKGILMDSLNFKTNNTTAKTLLIASKLVEEFNIDIAKANFDLFSKTIENYQKTTKFRSYLKIKHNLAYAIYNRNDLKKIGLGYSECKNNIDEFSNIKGINIWCVFAYNENTKLYDGSIRAKRGYIINKTANLFNGGGHKYASGVKNLSLKDIDKLLNILVKISNS